MKFKRDLNVGQEDTSQVVALAGVWIFLLAIGTLVFVAPSLYAISLVHQDIVSSGALPRNARATLDFFTALNGFLFMGLGVVIGYPIASASGKYIDFLFWNYEKHIFVMHMDLLFAWSTVHIFHKFHFL